ncbi:MAG: helix-turn-helix domain-containing protein [bacterium]
MRSLGDHLRRRRVDLGLLQRTVAERLGVREETVALWEKGLARPLPRHYPGVVQFLGYDPEVPSDALADRLRSSRRRLGLTQAELATRTGLDEGSVCRWESGGRQPSRGMLNRLEAILTALERGSGGDGGAESTERELPALSFFDRTRWRRKPPTELTHGQPTSLGDEIRQRRLELGLSQKQLGARIGVGRATIYRWERGEAHPPKAHQTKLRALLGRR